ncbi:MAG TPA: hypothetical protein VEK07_21960 [Polyangiaceae bacterium]|nr:hypothetical protein [Polyangiaceae bacterium]
MNSIIQRGAFVASVVLGLGIVASGCLTRPVTSTSPQLTTNFTSVVQNQVVNKVDILFDIDNSASMGDKQQYLVQAIPDLIDQLLNPDCVDSQGNLILDANNNPIQSTNNNGVQTCSQGQVAFPPVHDLHLGIVTSSLGQRLSEQDPGSPAVIICQTTATPNPSPTGIADHNDDQGHLVAREITYGAGNTTATEGPVMDAYVPSYGFNTPPNNWGGFLDWFPQTTVNANMANPLPTGLNADTVETTLVNDFTQMVQGVGIYGCGIESQLESWYRFLIQPDPYATLAINNPSTGNATAVWSGVDTTILQERADFLRPDSLVAVIVLSDENDSEIDVRSFGGLGYLFMGSGFPPPKSTSQCSYANGGPASSGCQNCQTSSTDPACTPAGEAVYTATNDWGYDPNLRHVHMKWKYGIDPQYPWQRYVLGLTSPVVPDRNGEYPPGRANYVLGMNNCTNPLFASELPSGSKLSGLTVTAGQSNPTLCNLPLGTARTPLAGATTSSLVFYAIIGGVPYQLLHFDPTSAQKSELSQADWVRILGQGPASLGLTDLESLTPAAYDYTGIDPHMLESYQDRTLTANAFSTSGFKTDASLTTCNGQATCANALTPANSVTAAGAPNNADPVNGREWVTDQPYNPQAANGTTAFAPHVLPVDRQYACIFQLTTPRDCTNSANGYQCDCPNTTTGLTAEQIPPLCNPTTPTQQVAAKAYPTVRELQVARLLGTQGIVSSLCPIHVSDNATGNDPLFGYRPAVSTIINRLKNALTNQCLPEQLPTNGDAGSTGEVPCLILVQMPPSDGGSCLNPTCPSTQGLQQPPNDPANPVLSKFCQTQEDAYVQGGKVGTDPATLSVCQLTQLTPQMNGGDFMNGTCAASQDPGWCYVVGSKGCAQAIVFPPNSPPSGSTAFLQCVEQSVNVLDGG